MSKQNHIYGIPLQHRACALVLAMSTACSPAMATAATPTIPGFYGKVPPIFPTAAGTPQLPVLLNLNPDKPPAGLSENPVTVNNTLTINQNAAQATIDWQSFNIAPGSVVIFNQKGPDSTGQIVSQPQWVALNRIYDASPSLIYGNIKADGKVYLINRNGILFGPDSQVNVHSLVASNLNITDQNFTNGKLRFTTTAYDTTQGAISSDASVYNYGKIYTDSGGSVFLVGPNVVNAGTISAPSGTINLIGIQGTGEVETAELTEDATANDVTYSDSQVPGTAYNALDGILITETGGRIGMYGATVQNDGLIRSITAFKKGGVVILAARDKVTTGANSKIESSIETSTDAADPQLNFNHPEIIFRGLATDSDPVPLSTIEHQGAITAPSGNVKMTARDRVFLADSSRIDVSGLWLDRPASSNLLEAQLNSVDLRDDYVQKNGTPLGLKIKVDVLTGSNIGNIKKNYLTMQTGAEERSTSGGSISFSGPSSQVTLDQLIIKQGAQLYFSGGGIRYATGAMATSRLISGNRLYDIGSAPQWISYDRLADSQTKSYKRFGVTDEFSGLYFGSGTPVGDLTAARTVGSDAGSVLFNARVSVLDGSLTGAVTRGLYQSAVTSYAVKDFDATDYKNYSISVRRGLEEPRGGAVTIGHELPAAPSAATNDNEQDFVTNAITITSVTTPLSGNFGVDDDLNRLTTEISADLLNNAGLGSLSLFANTSITTEAGAGLSLLPGGSFIARARRIEHAGTIDVPDGSVELSTRPDVSSYYSLMTQPNEVNSLYQTLIETIYLAADSRISTAGLEIDNSAAGMALHPATTTAHTNGGSILIQERTEQGASSTLGTLNDGHTLAMAPGALLDVSGGWLIDSKGTITGGNAGILELKAPTLSLAGELWGYSLPGKSGGEIKLHAGDVQVASRDLYLPSNMPVDAAIPDYLLGKLVLGEDRLSDTGFSKISLTAINDISFGDGALLTPSLTKLSMPEPAIFSQGTNVGNVVKPAGSDPSVAEYLDATSVTMTAGRNIYENSPFGGGGDSVNNSDAKIEITAGTGVKVAPGGSVTLTAPNIDIAGQIEALGGSVTAKSNNSLYVKTGGEILAGGYNKPVTTTVAGQPAGSVPQTGGSIDLQSAVGDVVLEVGSKVDVSGSAPVERLVAGADGAPVKVVVAGDPGSLSFSYSGDLTLDGEINGKARMNGIRGGDLSVTNLTGDLNIREEDVTLYQQKGFDGLTFKSSTGALLLPDKLDVTVGRSLTLDGRLLQGSPDGEVTLWAPWITLLSSSTHLADTPKSLYEGTGEITLAGGFIDVQGSILMDGFRDVTLQATRDLRFSSSRYTVGQNSNYWTGELGVTANLTLQAARVYPTTLSDFTVTSKGKVTVLPGTISDTSPVYSAGGSLTIAAEGGIEQRGTLLAPQGSINLIGGTREKIVNADGTTTYNDTQTSRVLLAEGSSTTTSGEVAVIYGSYDGATWSTHADILADGSVNNTGALITSAPAKGITLKGEEVIVRPDATLDLSGGGSVYATYFQSGIPGSLNPLTVTSPAKRYVILSDNSVILPGKAVYLDAVPELGLKAGVYSLLPADQFAFVPGALVIQDTGMQLVAGQKALTTQGYKVVSGYETITDTSISSQTFKGYSIRSAADVLKEGDFTVKSFTSGNGGDLTLVATGAVLNDTITAHPLQGYQGGLLTLSAKNVIVQNIAEQQPGRFEFDDPLLDNMAETLILDTAHISNKGFRELALGSKEYDSKSGSYSYSADTVTVTGDSVLKAPSVTLRANTAVTIEKDALVQATGDSADGIATVEVPTGTLYLNENGLIRADNGLRLNVGGMSLLGDFMVDHGSFSLTADNIIFANETYVQRTIDGVPQDAYLTAGNWTPGSGGSTSLADFDGVTLISRGDIRFQENVDIKAKGALTLDAGRYLIDNAASEEVKASFSAGGKLTLLNSGMAPADPALIDPAAPTNSSSLTFTANAIDISPRSYADKNNNKYGGILFDGFGTVTLNSSGDLTLLGAGTIKTAWDLNINAPRVTTSFYRYDADPADNSDVSIPYTAADISIDARSGNVAIAGNGGKADSGGTPGGSLEILAASIKVGDPADKNATVLDVPAGQVKLIATGDIDIKDKSSILATGSRSPAPEQPGVFSYSPGGSIIVQSSGGKINLATGSTLDVQASDQGDAGAVTLSAAAKGVTMAGAIKGSALNGQGGSFAIDSATLDGVGDKGGLDILNTILSDGGFNDRINIRSRSGDLTLSSGNTMTGREVVIAADTSANPDGTKNSDGSIDIAGTINADGADGVAGGLVELYAGNALTLESGSEISARGGANAGGGSVSLSSMADKKNGSSYAIQIKPDSKIDVSGTKGGTVSFRAYQINSNDVNISDLPVGAINGASRVSVEAARSYSLKETTPATVTAPANANIGDPAQYLADAAAFMTVASDLGPRLFTNVADDQKKYYHLQSGIELVSAVGTDLTLDTAWNLSARPGGETGILTLRAGGNLLINQNLIDAPTAMAKLYSVKSATTEAMQDSWGINLVAGAGNSSSANYLAAETGTGDLTIASGKTVYSENSQINFAAGHDVNLNGSTATAGPGFMINTLMKYNLGSYGGSVRGMAGNNLNLTANGSAIQTALGNIDIRAAGDLNLGTQSNTGAIRTTGEYDNSQKIETMPGTGIFVDAGPSSYWTYHNGGSISLDVAGSVNGNLEAANGWDGAYIDPTVSVKDKVYYPWYLAAGFGGKEKSGGSDVNVPVTVGIATMGGGDITVRTGGELLTQVGAFGSYNQGNLDIVSGGDMIGRFRVMNGTATLTSGGAFGRDESKNPTWRSVIEMADARLSVAAQGDVNLGTVLNPDNSRDRIFFGNTDKKFWNMTYSKDSSAAISSLGGNATFYGTDGFNAYNFTGSSTLLSSLLVRQRVLPVTFTLAAADDLNIRNEFYLAPSTTGNLGLYAGGNLNGAYKKTGESKVSTASIKMADVDVDSYYERQTDTGDKKTAILKADPGPNSRSIVIDHRDDPVPVIVRAGGDIDTVKLVLNKQAEITAGGDIKLLNFIGQNNSVDSVTIVSAQGNIDQGIKSENLSEIKVGGPGTLLVEAGKDINLGNSSGIESIGNSFNRAFTGEDTDSSLIITAGAKQRMLPTDADSGATSLAADYFSILRQAGDDYSNLKAAGKNEEALSRIEDARTEIRKYFDEPTGSDGSGNITMIDSLIRSRKGDIYLMARGDVNVGRSSVSDSAGSKKDTGITTTFGGRLNIYTGGDLNVNESRTMTFMGGDILIWSDQGNINAGRGSKTALSSPESARPDYDNNGVLIGLLAPAPALGSGVRASTYDPDGSGGPLQMPLPGDIYLFAPKGIIDAGEAGIAGGKVTLGATQVLNTKNISFSAGSVGVPTSSDSSVSLGALGGNSNLADSSKMIETATSGGASKENAQRKMVQPMDDFLSKYLDVKVIGFDADTIPASDQDTKDEQERKKKKK